MTGQGVPPGKGADDPLMARALVAQSGGQTIAIVSVDLVKIRHDLADAAIGLACERTGIDRDAVMICATHDHSSPFVPMKGPKNKDYLSRLPARIAGVVNFPDYRAVYLPNCERVCRKRVSIPRPACSARSRTCMTSCALLRRYATMWTNCAD